jgi:hypothetical protein
MSSYFFGETVVIILKWAFLMVVLRTEADLSYVASKHFPNATMLTVLSTNNKPHPCLNNIAENTVINIFLSTIL